MRKIIHVIVACVLGASFALSVGCSTVKGLGQDISKGGREIQRAAS